MCTKLIVGLGRRTATVVCFYLAVQRESIFQEPSSGKMEATVTPILVLASRCIPQTEFLITLISSFRNQISDPIFPFTPHRTPSRRLVMSQLFVLLCLPIFATRNIADAQNLFPRRS